MSRLDQAKKIADRYRNDPHVWGRTKQVVGGLLIADGLVGLENPFDGKKTRPGILGAFIPILVGLAFCIPILFVSNAQIDTDATTTGHITNVTTSRNSDGEVSCGLTASYTIDGRTYTAGSVVSSSSYCNKRTGGEITVSYQAAHPDRGQIEDSNFTLLLWIFAGAGGLLALSGVVTVMVRAASIVGGVALLISGRKQAAAHPDINGNAAAAVAQVKQEMTALLTGARGGIGSLLGRTLTSPATGNTAAPAHGPHQPVAPPVAPPVPPVGWYPTADARYERYWDGAQWSENARPVETAP